MPECDYCGDEFEDERSLHLHWGENHEDELSSHDEEKVKKARREQQEEKEAEMRKKKKYAGYGLGAALALILVGFVGAQVLQTSGTGEKQSFNLEGQPMIGDSDAPVTVVEFGDYRCPHCANFEFNTFSKLKKNFIEQGDVKFYFVNFAFLGPESTQAAVASECVYRQDPDQFWQYHKALFENQKSQIGVDALVKIAEDNTQGLDYQKLRSCIRNQETAGKVRKDRQLGQSKGVEATPTVFVNGKKVNNWQYSGLAKKIDEALKK